MTEVSIEQRFARIAELLKTETPPVAVRREISKLILESIDHFGEDLGYWEKLHLGSAINSLAHNLAGPSESKVWLHYSFANLAAAFWPKANRNDEVPPTSPRF